MMDDLGDFEVIRTGCPNCADQLRAARRAELQRLGGELALADSLLVVVNEMDSVTDLQRNTLAECVSDRRGQVLVDIEHWRKAVVHQGRLIVEEES